MSEPFDMERFCEEQDFRREMARDLQAEEWLTRQDTLHRYALQYVGPAGYVRYMDRYGELTDNPDAAVTFANPELAFALHNGGEWHPGTVFSVVNLEDPEEAVSA